MGFDDALRTAERTSRAECTVAVALAALAPGEREKAQRAIDDRQDNGTYLHAGSHVAKALSGESGVKVAGGTLNRHRRRGQADGCACEL